MAKRAAKRYVGLDQPLGNWADVGLVVLEHGEDDGAELPHHGADSDPVALALRPLLQVVVAQDGVEPPRPVGGEPEVPPEVGRAALREMGLRALVLAGLEDRRVASREGDNLRGALEPGHVADLAEDPGGAHGADAGDGGDRRACDQPPQLPVEIGHLAPRELDLREELAQLERERAAVLADRRLGQRLQPLGVGAAEPAAGRLADGLLHRVDAGGRHVPHLESTAVPALPKSSQKNPWNSGNTTSTIAWALRLQSPTMWEREVRDLDSDLRSSVSDFVRRRSVGFPARSHRARASASTASFFTFLTLIALRQLEVSRGFTSKTW